MTENTARTAITLAVQESMLADLTPEQRARYDAILAQRSAEPVPAGLVTCETCGWTYSAAFWCSNCNPKDSAS